MHSNNHNSTMDDPKPGILDLKLEKERVGAELVTTNC